MIRGFRNCQGCVAPAATNRQQAPGLPVGPLLLRRNRSVFVCHLMGYLLDSGNPKILCLLVARAREAVSRNSAGRSPGRRRARAHASDGVLRMPCRRAARDGPGTGNQRPFQRGRPVAEATTHGGYLSQVDSPFAILLSPPRNCQCSYKALKTLKTCRIYSHNWGGTLCGSFTFGKVYLVV